MSFNDHVLKAQSLNGGTIRKPYEVSLFRGCTLAKDIGVPFLFAFPGCPVSSNAWEQQVNEHGLKLHRP